MTRTINRAAMTTKTITQTNTVSEKFDREEDDQDTHEIEDQTNQEMKKMSPNATKEDKDNHSNQKNPNNDAYYKSRGYDGKDDYADKYGF